MAGMQFFDMPLLRSAVFHPRQVPRGRASVDGDYPAPAINGAPAARIGYRAYPHPRRSNAPTILHFHGNGEVAADMDACVGLFHNAGWAVVALDFRGYGWSTGTPSILTLCSDAAAILPHLATVLGKAGAGPSVPVALYGRSIGSACAVELASAAADRFVGLVLEGAIASLLELPMALQLSMMIPNGDQLLRALPDPFEQCLKLERAALQRVLLLHGTVDEIVPPAQAHRLHAACGPSARLVMLRGTGHNNVLLDRSYASSLTSFLTELKEEHMPSAEEQACQDSGKADGVGWWPRFWSSAEAAMAHAKSQVLVCFGGRL